MNGADDEPEDETQDRRGAECEDRLACVAGAGDCGRSVPVLRCSRTDGEAAELLEFGEKLSMRCLALEGVGFDHHNL